MTAVGRQEPPGNIYQTGTALVAAISI